MTNTSRMRTIAPNHLRSGYERHGFMMAFDGKIVQDLQVALSEFSAIAEVLGGEAPAGAEPE